MYIFLLHDSMPCISTALKNRLRNSNFVALKFYKGCDRARHHPNSSSVSDRFNGWDLEPIWQNLKHGCAENYKIPFAMKVTWLFKLIGIWFRSYWNISVSNYSTLEFKHSYWLLQVIWSYIQPIRMLKFRRRVNWGRKYFLPRAQV